MTDFVFLILFGLILLFRREGNFLIFLQILFSYVFISQIRVTKIKALQKIPEAFGKKCFANMGKLLIIFLGL